MKRLTTFPCLIWLLFGSAQPTRGDIFQWEYINPADPSQGKQESATLAPDGAGAFALPVTNLNNRNLTMAYLIGADLNGATGISSNFTNADFSQAILTNASFLGSTLTAANLAGAEVRGAHLGRSAVSLYDCTRFVFLQGCVQYGWYTFFTGTSITPEQLYSTASYNAHDLTGIKLEYYVLSDANLAAQNLTSAELPYATLINANLSHAILANANLAGANLTGANLTGADVRGARVGWAIENLEGWICENPSVGGCLNWIWGAVSRSTPGGINLAQLSATASYQARDLSGIDLTNISLAGANFAGFNLTNANLSGAAFTGADFSGADARGARNLNLTGAVIANRIGADGRINGLDLGADQTLVVRDYDGNSSNGSGPIPITVDQHMSIGAGGTLRMMFEADDWASTISFAAGIPVTLGGTLELTFAADVNLAGQVGRAFDLFDWTGVNPTGTFEVSSPYPWDLSELYTTGEVTLLSPFTPGDADGDGFVNRNDATILARSLGRSGGLDWSDGDFDNNRHVDMLDAAMLQSHLGQVPTAPSAAIPEPNTFALITTGLFVLVVFYRARTVTTG